MATSLVSNFAKFFFSNPYSWKTYIIIQAPAFNEIHEYGTNKPDSNTRLAHAIHYYALIGFLLAAVFFVGYLIYMVCSLRRLLRDKHIHFYQIKYADVEPATDLKVVFQQVRRQ